ncbi:HEAT repeat domain-containing protein [Streptomyces sp. NBC_01283]|uniref:HEAT repeat domain-containing protein n=1 Tax=Streptomyces sp. NBC_01283 TaxID=2903812 RepID=UPI00352C57A4|nr:HEAT repeat domain-containing protein [Streptomyces sp. NBC_01283]
MTTTTLTGIEDIDWASMNHAYGDASDVPDLLRGLASPDPAERDEALDGMYGAVHHQGDVYDSTLACVPFLFVLVSDASVRDRGTIVGLLRSIAGEEVPDPEEIGGLFEDEEEDAAWVANFVDAAALIRGRSDVFLEHLSDTDPELRAAAPGALAHLHADPARVFAALRERFPVERDGEAVRSLARAVGVLGVRHVELRPDAGRLLAEVLAFGGGDPELRLTVLTQLARCAPDLLPEETVDIAVEVMRIAHEDESAAEEGGSGAQEAPAERPRTDTMVSYLRDLEAAHRASIDADLADDLLRDLHIALDDRTEERFDLLHAQLRAPDWGQRMAAVQESGLLLTGWRAPNDLAVVLLARQLIEHDERLSRAALNELACVHPIAHVVADVLEVCLTEWEDDWDPSDWEDSLFGRALKALALQGDARAVPYLAAVLESGGGVPEYVDRWVEAMGPAAGARLAPVLHGRLAGPGHSARGYERSRLISALGACAPAASLPLLTTALHGDHCGAAFTAVGRYGSAAADAAPRLREVASDVSKGDLPRLDAADALWSVTGASEDVLPVLRDVLRSDRSFAQVRAVRIAGGLGPEGVPLVPRLRELMAASVHLRSEAAIALWHIRADASDVLPVLIDQWTAAPDCRPQTVACLLEMGPAAAPALPLLHRELASPRRHNNYGAQGNMRYDVASDETLLRDCRRLVAALEP